ncbi:MAG: hypothetical protein Q9162_007230 [Coniocarpon cinnabarinum]
MSVAYYAEQKKSLYELLSVARTASYAVINAAITRAESNPYYRYRETLPDSKHILTDAFRRSCYDTELRILEMEGAKQEWSAHLWSNNTCMVRFCYGDIAQPIENPLKCKLKDDELIQPAVDQDEAAKDASSSQNASQGAATQSRSFYEVYHFAYYNFKDADELEQFKKWRDRRDKRTPITQVTRQVQSDDWNAWQKHLGAWLKAKARAAIKRNAGEKRKRENTTENEGEASAVHKKSRIDEIASKVRETFAGKARSSTPAPPLEESLNGLINLIQPAVSVPTGMPESDSPTGEDEESEYEPPEPKAAVSSLKRPRYDESSSSTEAEEPVRKRTKGASSASPRTCSRTLSRSSAPGKGASDAADKAKAEHEISKVFAGMPQAVNGVEQKEVRETREAPKQHDATPSSSTDRSGEESKTSSGESASPDLTRATDSSQSSASTAQEPPQQSPKPKEVIKLLPGLMELKREPDSVHEEDERLAGSGETTAQMQDSTSTEHSIGASWALKDEPPVAPDDTAVDSKHSSEGQTGRVENAVEPCDAAHDQAAMQSENPSKHEPERTPDPSIKQEEDTEQPSTEEEDSASSVTGDAKDSPGIDDALDTHDAPRTKAGTPSHTPLKNEPEQTPNPSIKEEVDTEQPSPGEETICASSVTADANDSSDTEDAVDTHDAALGEASTPPHTPVKSERDQTPGPSIKREVQSVASSATLDVGSPSAGGSPVTTPVVPNNTTPSTPHTPIKSEQDPTPSPLIKREVQSDASSATLDAESPSAGGSPVSTQVVADGTTPSTPHTPIKAESPLTPISQLVKEEHSKSSSTVRSSSKTSDVSSATQPSSPYPTSSSRTAGRTPEGTTSSPGTSPSSNITSRDAASTNTEPKKRTRNRLPSEYEPPRTRGKRKREEQSENQDGSRTADSGKTTVLRR